MRHLPQLMDYTANRDTLDASFVLGGNRLCICYVYNVEVERECSSQRCQDLVRKRKLPSGEVVGSISQRSQHSRWKERRKRVSSNNGESFAPYEQDAARFVGEH